MKYFVIENTVTGPVKTGPYTAKKALSVVENIDTPESKLRIEDENGEKLDKVDLRVQVDQASK